MNTDTLRRHQTPRHTTTKNIMSHLQHLGCFSMFPISQKHGKSVLPASSKVSFAHLVAHKHVHTNTHTHTHTHTRTHAQAQPCPHARARQSAQRKRVVGKFGFSQNTAGAKRMCRRPPMRRRMEGLRHILFASAPF